MIQKIPADDIGGFICIGFLSKLGAGGLWHNSKSLLN